jgi:four helix bundle protein
MLDAGCWMLDVGCWMLDVGCWKMHDFFLLSSEIKRKIFYELQESGDMELSQELSIDIHKMTLRLPKFDQYEEAQQIRKSCKSIRSTIVEGYGRRYYKGDYIKYIIYALASNMETVDHLEMLYETGSLTDKELFNDLHSRLNILGRKINNFLQSVQTSHQRPGSVAESQGDYNTVNEPILPTSNI